MEKEKGLTNTQQGEETPLVDTPKKRGRKPAQPKTQTTAKAKTETKQATEKDPEMVIVYIARKGVKVGSTDYLPMRKYKMDRVTAEKLAKAKKIKILGVAK
jgi:hypothetical protein